MSLSLTLNSNGCSGTEVQKLYSLHIIHHHNDHFVHVKSKLNIPNCGQPVFSNGNLAQSVTTRDMTVTLALPLLGDLKDFSSDKQWAIMILPFCCCRNYLYQGLRELCIKVTELHKFYFELEVINHLPSTN